MNVLIIGDSWGCSLGANDGDPAWLEFDFFNKGHNVYNRSKFGNNNTDALRDGFIFLSGVHPNNVQVDLIIWYFTNLVRGRPKSATTRHANYQDFISDISANTVYDANRIRTKFPDIKWAIIGGHAPIYDIDSYAWADFKIKDWRSELLGEELPISCCIGEFDFLERMTDPDVLERELPITEKIMQLGRTRTPDIFCDGVHPNVFCSNKLSNRILDFFGANKHL